jgi:SAM-dependent methyltransferase
VIEPNPILKWIRTRYLEPTLRRLPRTEKVLDLCCGYGFYFGINPNARAVDGDPRVVEHLRERGFHVDLCNVLEGLPHPDGEFEHVIAHDVLEHFTLDELHSLFDEVHRVLAPHGVFWVHVPNRKGYDHGLRIGAGHKMFVTRDEIERLAPGRFDLRNHYPEPFPRWIGRHFTHNKEVFHLVRVE